VLPVVRFTGRDDRRQKCDRLPYGKTEKVKIRWTVGEKRHFACCTLSEEFEMPKTERARETVSGLPTLEYLSKKVQDGWKLVGLEWEREVPGIDDPGGEPRAWTEQIPYGLRVSDDCTRLVENSIELEIITIALDMIVEDCPLSRVSDELNMRGYRMRQGTMWTPSALFGMLPRMIQVGPKLFTSQQWMERRQRLPKVTI